MDGEEVPLVDADHAMVAVEVPEGEHTVDLAYAPPGRTRGILISIAAAVVLAAIWVSGFGSRSPHAPADDSD